MARNGAVVHLSRSLGNQRHGIEAIAVDEGLDPCEVSSLPARVAEFSPVHRAISGVDVIAW